MLLNEWMGFEKIRIYIHDIIYLSRGPLYLSSTNSPHLNTQHKLYATTLNNISGYICEKRAIIQKCIWNTSNDAVII